MILNNYSKQRKQLHALIDTEMVRYRVMEFCCAKIQKHEMKYLMTEVLKYRNTKHRKVTMISEIGQSTGKT